MNKNNAHRRKNAKPTRFGDFVLLFPFLSKDCRERNLDKLNEAEKPDYLCRKRVPKDFTGITFGQYSDLCDALQMGDSFKTLAAIIKAVWPTLSKKDIDDAPAYDVWGFCRFAVGEVDKINKMFGSIKIEKTSQEIAAGVDNLQFGTFGILDWYARRMGITDQQDVFDVKWVRIYQCMSNDAEEISFQRRYINIINEEIRRRTKTRK